MLMVKGESDLKEARRGDHKAIDRLNRAYRESIRRHCHRMMQNSDDAEDATQDTFARAFRNLGALTEEDRFSNWLYRIATNVCLTNIKRTREAISLDTSGDPHLQASLIEADPSFNVIERIHAEEIARVVFTRLSEDARKVVWLHYYENLHSGEIENRLGMPGGTVRSHLSRSRQIVMKVAREFNAKE